MAIETLTDWNATLSCCCPMPSCVVPVKTCRSTFASSNAPFYVDPTTGRYYKSYKLTGDESVPVVSSYDNRYWWPPNVWGNVWETDASYLSFEKYSSGSQFRGYIKDPRFVRSSCYGTDSSTTTYPRETTVSGSYTSYSGYYTPIAHGGPNYTVYLTSEASWVWEARPPGSGTYFKKTINEMVWDVDWDGGGWVRTVAVGYPRVRTEFADDCGFNSRVSATVYEDEVTQEDLENDLTELLDTIDETSCLSYQTQCYSSRSSTVVLSDQMYQTAYKGWHRWSITNHMGSWFKITWDVLFTPTSGDPTFTALDQTWEWTGPTGGPPPGDEDDWKSPWFDIHMAYEPGTSTIVNIRYSCYRTPYGDPVEVTGTSYETPVQDLYFSTPEASQYHPAL